MRLVVNGDPMTTEAGTIGQLIGELQLAPERVAVEVNQSVIRKADYEAFRLRDGDAVEIVNFVGGG